jgi:hypothetical protein
MAQLFIDTASISSLKTTSSYIGSGSTSFNKENSFLRTNNGVRQGINNGVNSGPNETVNHAEGFSHITNGTGHIEGGNNTLVVGSYIGHIEGYNNTGKLTLSHIEGVYNSNLEQGNITLASSHIEGGYNTGSTGWGRHHIEGYNHQAIIGQRVASHVEGINNKSGASSLLSYSHIEGINNSWSFNSLNPIHIEGFENLTVSSDILGAHTHVEGRNNSLQLFSANVSANHIEGYSNIILHTDAGNYGGNHINGISCSLTNNIYSFMNGFGSTSSYSGSISFTSGQFNSSNLSIYSNIGPSTNAIRYNFTIGGGINNGTRANIFEIAIITTASNTGINVTQSIALPWVSESGEFASDLLAAAGGVPLGGFYRTGSNLKIRLS